MHLAEASGERQQPKQFEQLNARALKSKGITNPELPLHHNVYLKRTGNHFYTRKTKNKQTNKKPPADQIIFYRNLHY